MSTQGEFRLRGGTYFPPIYSEAKWRATPLIDLPSWKGAKRIGFDYETKDTTIQELGPGCRRPDAYVTGFSFAIEDGPKHYVPFRHGDPRTGDGMEDNVEGDAVGWLREQFKLFDGDIVGANLPYELDWTLQMGIDVSSVRNWYDIQVADPLLYELEDYYSLDAIAIRRDLGGKNETLLREAARQYGVDPKSDMWRLPARLVGPYAEDDALLPLKILRKQENQINEDGIEECWKMETRLLPILVKMTRKGVRVNEDRLAKVEAWTLAAEANALKVVQEYSGIPIPVGQTMNVELLTRALAACGLGDCIGQTTKGDSVTGDLLAKTDHPMAKAINTARRAAKIRTTYVNGVRKHMINGRIHCTFNQIRKTDDTTGENSGVAYGRLSASHPNMQNQPGNSRFTGDNDIGPMWRSIYEAEEGQLWCALDLKQQEPKWSFHYGAILEELVNEGKITLKRGMSVRGALALCERLKANPMLDTYEPIVEQAKVKRSTAKIIWLARAYGQGDGTLCENLGLPTQEVCYSRELWATVPVDSEAGRQAMKNGGFTWKGAGEEGKKIIDKFDTEMSFLKTAAKLAKQRADERGYVTLLSGRRCHFKKSSEGRGYDWTSKAFNRIIQGTSAEQTKRIMIALDDAGYGKDLMLQVHDEVDGSWDSPEVAQSVAEVMRHAVPMRVPTVVDVECGPSWGESMTIEEEVDGKKIKRPYVWSLG